MNDAAVNEPRLRILLITGSLPPMRCGVGEYTHQLASSLSHFPQVQVGVITSRLAASGGTALPYERFAAISEWTVREVGAMLRIIRKWKPTIVHIQHPTLGYGKGSLARTLPALLALLRIPVVQTWHEVYPPKALLELGILFSSLIQAIAPGGLVVVRESYRAHTHWLLRWAYLNKTVRYIANGTAIPVVRLNPSDHEEVRKRYGRPNSKLIAFFGFLLPSKRVELLFSIVDPEDSHLVIAGDSLGDSDLKLFSKSQRDLFAAYHQSLRQLATSARWADKVTMTGFVPSLEAASIMAAADAIVLPFSRGGGEWSTTLRAAQSQGTFVLTTSKNRSGYDEAVNTYFSSDRLDEMKSALHLYAGKRTPVKDNTAEIWRSISCSHLALYRTQVKNWPIGDR